MKNLKRALALLVVVTMMISTVAFASFSDVTGSTNVANAVNVGVGLNLFKGYEDGTFKPEGDITRAEFAAIVVRALGQEAQANGAKGKTAFTDVIIDDKDWASGYINIVTRLGIVNGYGDGKFGPEDKVTYEQAIKMIVVALGYTPAIGSAGYPVGYLTKAGELGITSGVAGSNGVPANRGTVAQLVFNSLDVPLMVQTGYGTNLDFVVQDGVGTDAVRKTIMSEYLDVVKLQVFVNEAYALTTTNKNDLVKVNLLNSYKSKYGKVSGDEFYVVDKSSTTNNLDSRDFNIGTSNIASFVGSKAIVYIKYDDTSSDEPVVVFAQKDTTKVDEVTFKSDDLDSTKTDFVPAVAAVGTVGTPGYVAPIPAIPATKVTVAYWANSTDKNAEKVTLELNSAVYINGLQKTSIDTGAEIVTTLGATDAAFYGEVTLAKNGDGTQDYDTVYITSYTNIVVDSINVNSSKITSKNNTSTIDFDPTDKAITATLYDTKGAVMKWTDLKEWDVVSAKISTDSNKTVIVGQLVSNSITGTITEIGGDNNDEFTIGGKVYKVDTDGMDVADLALSDEGTFYLDILGRIAYYNTDAAISTNYAYVVNAVLPTEGLDIKTQLKIFTVKGELLSLYTSSKVKLDGISAIPTADLTKTKTTTVVTTAENTSTSTVTYGTTAVGVVGTVPNPVAYPYTVATTVSVVPTTTKGVITKGQFITYAVNANNEITTIDRSTSVGTSLANVKGNFTQYGTAKTSSEYTSATQSISVNGSRVYLTDKTIVMVAPETSVGVPSTIDDNYELYNVASLNDGNNLTNITLFNVDEDKNVSAILVNDAFTPISSSNGVAVVTGVSKGSNTDGTTRYNVSVLQNSEKTVLNTYDDSITAPTIGDFAIPVKNAKGEIRDFTLITKVNRDANLNALKLVTLSEAAITANLSGLTKYYIGDVKEIRKNNVTLKTIANSVGIDKTVVGTTKRLPTSVGTDFSASGANVYVYDARSSSTSNRVTVDSINTVDVRLATSKDAPIAVDTTIFDVSEDEAVSNVVAVAREYDGKIIDVVLYIFN